MDSKKLGRDAVSALKKIYPDATCALQYGGDPWRLLVMGRLSAQCTDRRVNIVCDDLFEKYADAISMAKADIADIEKIVKPCGLFHVKASDLVNMSKMIISDFDGKVPDTMEKLLLLPGVGRKIANLILGDIYGKPAVVTDTHCIRICGRLGFYDEELKNPPKIEKILAKAIEPKEQSDFCHRIVSFGRDICTARNPSCENCALSGICKHYKDSNK